MNIEQKTKTLVNAIGEYLKKQTPATYDALDAAYADLAATKDEMSPDEYQEKAHSFATGGGDCLEYAMFGLVEEVGELFGKVKITGLALLPELEHFMITSRLLGRIAKEIRKRGLVGYFDYRITPFEGFDKELGDVAWMIANVAHHAGYKMSDILSQNIAKLEDRKARGVIVGEGDNR